MEKPDSAVLMQSAKHVRNFVKIGSSNNNVNVPGKIMKQIIRRFPDKNILNAIIIKSR